MASIPYDFTTFDIPPVCDTCDRQYLGNFSWFALPINGTPGVWSFPSLDVTICTDLTDQAECGTARKTALKLVERALRSIHVLDGSETLSDQSDIDTGMEIVEEIITHWNTQGLSIFTANEVMVYVPECQPRVALPFRALSVEEVFWLNKCTETPLIENSRWEYWELPQKSQSGTPSQYYTDRGRSCTDVLLWPVPDKGGWMRVSYGRPIAVPLYPASTLDLPQEAMTAFRYVLAARLADEYMRSGPEVDRIIARAEEMEAEFFADQGPDIINFTPDIDGRR